MICKFCGAELEEQQKICPVCGKALEETPTFEEEAFAQEPAEEIAPAEEAEESVTDETAETEEQELCEEVENTEEQEPVKTKTPAWKYIVAIVGGALLLTALALGILYGMGFRYVPATNDIYAKDVYTVEDAKADKYTDKVIAKVGDMELTNAELQVYYWNGAYNFANNYSSYLSYFGLDVSAPLSQQTSYEDENMTWQQYFLQNAINNWTTYARLCLTAKEEGFEMTEDMTAELEAARQTLTDMSAENGHEDPEELLDEAMGKVCTVDGYLAYIKNCIEGDAFYSNKAAALMPTAQEVEDYFTANEAALAQQGIAKDGKKLVDVRHILLTPEEAMLDEEGNPMKTEEGYTVYTEESWAECQQAAEALLQQWLDNTPTEESFAELANANSVDGGSNTNGGLYSQVSEGQMVPEFEAWIMDASRATGDYGLVKTPYGYHIMYYVSGEDAWYINTLSALYNERLANFMTEMEQKWPVEVTYKNIVLSKDVLVESDTEQ